MNRGFQRFSKSIAITFLMCVFPFVVHAQISQGGFPSSYSNIGLRSAVQIPKSELSQINVDELKTEDSELGITYRYGIVDSVDVDLKLSGVKTKVDSGYIWRYTIVADSAKSLKLLFSKYVVPSGAKLFLYNSDYSTIYGSFNKDNMTDDSTFVIADFPGNRLTIEYFEPTETEFSGSIILSQVTQAYRDLFEMMSLDASSADYVDVNCSRGIYWEKEKHAVCKYTFTEGVDSYICSGSLINNLNNDGTPYFLTANHCVGSATVASTVTAYFNYETKKCGGAEKQYKTLSGASIKAMGEATDFTLLRFNSTPPSSYQPYYAGWDLSQTSDSSTCIHHPEGLLKKISFDDDAISTYHYILSWDVGVNSPINTHWLVVFDEGVIAGGSSGSPLFNTDRRIIGQLHGSGDTDCYYGKLSYSWSHSDYSSIKNYLCFGSDTTFIDGYYPSDNAPDVAFVADRTSVCPTTAVSFTDLSAFDVSLWEWSFSPSTVTYLDGTSASSKNPIVSFDNNGSYNVTLVVENSSGKDSITYTDYITIGNVLSIDYQSNIENSCYPSSDSIILVASNASDYIWTLDSFSSLSFYISDTLSNASKVIIQKRDGVSRDSVSSVSGLVIGTQGTCVDTLQFSIALSSSDYDNVETALPLSLGYNGVFSNNCAVVEENEPKPTTIGCTSQRGWCDEGNGIELNNSVWFYFVAPSNGDLTIKTSGQFDTQLALYKAGSPDSILNGEYQYIAANDNVSSYSTDSRITASVDWKSKYWIQVDGGSGGDFGTFSLTLSIEEDDKANSEILMYPMPVAESLTLESASFVDLSSARVTIYMMDGTLLQSEVLSVSNDGKIIVPIKNYLSQGTYVLWLNADGINYKKLIIVD